MCCILDLEVLNGSSVECGRAMIHSTTQKTLKLQTFIISLSKERDRVLVYLS